MGNPLAVSIQQRNGAWVAFLSSTRAASSARRPLPRQATVPLQLWSPCFPHLKPHGPSPTRERVLSFTSSPCSGPASGSVRCGWLGIATPRVTHIGNRSWVLLRTTRIHGSRAVATAANAVAQQPALVVVESPTKAKKIQGFLGDGYKVLASYGHVRDLPSKEGSVLPDQDFEVTWQLLPKAGSRMDDIAMAAAGAPLLVLATDPDREGEAISWHIEQELRRRGVLKHVGEVRRITFTEVTRGAVITAFSAGREVSQPLVDAYLARRAVDYLMGFHLSPVLWRKLPGGPKSAGRVQSVTLRLVCEREAQVERFTPTPYWSIRVDLMADGRTYGGPSPPSAESPPVVARLTHVDGRRLGPLEINSQEMADDFARRMQVNPVRVSKVKRRQLQRHPPPPFTTSSLQQEASKRLGFGVARTMKAAQQLYEGTGTGEGLITYMRTDGVTVSAEVVEELRTVSLDLYDIDAVSAQPRQYKSRTKNAQEAHEAIRPTKPTLITPASLPASLDHDQRALYVLIWQRALASQMSSAVYDVVLVEFTAGGGMTLQSSGSVLRQPGFLRVYDDVLREEGEAEEEADLRRQLRAGAGDSTVEEADDVAGSVDESALGLKTDNVGGAVEQLLALEAGWRLRPTSVLPTRHLTRPPPRYTEASLVRALEERGIGRPSTYAPIMSLLQGRGYLVREGRSLVATPTGRVLTAFLQHYFPKYVDVDFTSHMESQLDEVAGGRAAWKAVLAAFWDPFRANVASMSAIRTTEVYDMLNDALESYIFQPSAPFTALTTTTSSSTSNSQVLDIQATAVPATATAAPLTAVADPRQCPKCGRGRLVVKPSRFGGFIGCSLYSDPDESCDFSWALMRVHAGKQGAAAGTSANAAEGSDSNLEGSLSAMWGGMPGGAMERLLGSHPETGQPVWVRLGQFGMYVQLGDTPSKESKQTVKKAPRGRKGKLEQAAETQGQKAKVPAPKPIRKRLPTTKDMTLQSVTLPMALSLLALPRDLGPHPDDGLPIVANSGPFGPYVAHNGLSVSLKASLSLQEVDVVTAVQLLAAKRARQAAREAQGLPPKRSGRVWGRGAARGQGARGMGGRAAPLRDVIGAGEAEKGIGGEKESGASVDTASTSSSSSSNTSSRGSVLSKAGYLMYMKQRWQEIKVAEGKEAKYHQALSRIGAEWQALGKEEKCSFVEAAASAVDTGTVRCTVSVSTANSLRLPAAASPAPR